MERRDDPHARDHPEDRDVKAMVHHLHQGGSMKRVMSCLVVLGMLYGSAALARQQELPDTTREEACAASPNNWGCPGFETNRSNDAAAKTVPGRKGIRNYPSTTAEASKGKSARDDNSDDDSAQQRQKH